MLKYFNYLSIFLILSGCAHKPISYLKAPSLNLENLSNIEVNSIVKKYSEAKMAQEKNDFIKACELFTELFEIENFSLRAIAAYRSIETCPLTNSDLEDLIEKLQDEKLLASWNEEKILDLSIPKFRNFKNNDFLHPLLSKLSQYKSIPLEKEKLLLEAIKIAKAENEDEAQAEYFQKLLKVSPRYETIINEQNVFNVAKDFERVRDFKKARDLYTDIINGTYPIDLKYKAYNNFRTSFKVERNLKTFNEKTQEMELFFKSLLDNDSSNIDLQKYWVDSRIALIRALWTAHENEKSKELLNDFFNSSLGTNNQKATAYFVYGGILLEEKDLSGALIQYESGIKEKPDDLATIENLQWSLVWLNYLNQNYEKAINFADRFTKQSSNPSFYLKLYYWMAKSHQKINQINEAQTIFKKILEEDSFNFYGILSSSELKIQLPLLKSTPEQINTSEDETLDWLIVIKELEFARMYQRTIDSKYKTINERIFAMKLYGVTGWFEGGMRQVSNFPLKMRKEIMERFHYVIFPTAFSEIIQKNSQTYNLPSTVTFSIIRQESSFNPNARSWADAFGLMQMIPEAAIKLSTKYNIPYKDFTDLYNPDINVQLGTALLGELKNKYQNKFIPTVASYNASEDAVQTWLRDRHNGNDLEFIELVPYEETRNYIKLVFRNMITYKRILEANTFDVDLKFNF